MERYLYVYYCLLFTCLYVIQTVYQQQKTFKQLMKMHKIAYNTY